MVCAYEKRDRVLVQILPREVDCADLYSLSNEVHLLREDLATWPHRLVDLRNLNKVDVNWNDLYSEHRAVAPFPSNFKAALLVTTDLQMGFARLYQKLNVNPGVNIEVFTDEAIAFEWFRQEEALSA